MKDTPVDGLRLLQPWLAGLRQPGKRFDANGAIVQSLFALLRLSPHFENASEKLEDALAEREVAPASPERQPGREAAIERLRADIEESRKVTAARHQEIDSAVDLIPSDASAQTEVLIVCPRDGRAGGRMHIVNPRSHPVRLSFTARYGAGVPTSYAESLDVTFQPSHPSLAVEEVCAVRIAIDLTRCPNDTVQKLAFHVEARHEDECLAIAWVEVNIVDDMP